MITMRSSRSITLMSDAKNWKTESEFLASEELLFQYLFLQMLIYKTLDSLIKFSQQVFTKVGPLNSARANIKIGMPFSDSR